MDDDDAMTKKSTVKFGEELAYSGDGTKFIVSGRCSFLGAKTSLKKKNLDYFDFEYR